MSGPTGSEYVWSLVGKPVLVLTQAGGSAGLKTPFLDPDIVFCGAFPPFMTGIQDTTRFNHHHFYRRLS